MPHGPAVAALAASATAVALQVYLPRLFSVLLWYHLAFLAVSLAMLGFAAGGTVVRRARARGRPPGGGFDRPRLLAAASLSLLVALALALRLPIDAANLLSDPADGLLLLILVAALALPFVLLGAALCSALDEAGQALGTTYAASFAGGAAGALLCLLALEFLGTRRAAGALACLPLLGCLRRPRLLALLALAAAVTALALPDAVLPRASRKHFPRVPADAVLAERSNARSDVLFYENREHHGLWDAALLPDVHVPETIGAAIDAWAITFITKRDGPDDFPPLLDRHPAGLAYSGAHPGFAALVIGAGGGWDVLSALHAGAASVTAVELDGLIVDAVQDRWADWSGHLYQDPRVEVHVAEGRHFAEHDARRYDRIVLAGVDTFAATHAGAFALAENHLYTVEAFQTWLSRLRDGGLLFMTRWWFEPPRQTLRLVLTAAEALRRQGVADPRRRICVLLGNNALLLVKQGSDFSAAELDALERDARSRGARTIYAWGRPSHPELVAALDAPDPAAFADAYPYRVDPTTDDRPFFFEHGRLATLFRAEGNWIHDRLGGQEVLVITTAALALLASLLLSGGRTRTPGSTRAALPFLLLGAAYLAVEVATMQRLVLFLGHPIHAVAVVLVALLAWSGTGALLSRKLAPARAPAVLASAGVLVALLVTATPALTAFASHWPLPARAAAVAALLATPGLAMGACFPLAVRRLQQHDNTLLPSAFLWNGVASVLTAPLAVLLSMNQGITATQATGAALYVLAALGLLLTPRAIGARSP